MKALRELAGFKKTPKAEEEWDSLFSTQKRRHSRPPASLPLGKTDADLFKEQDASRTGFHDPVYLEDAYNTLFGLDRHELSSVSERTEGSTVAAMSPRPATSDSFPTSGSQNALSHFELFGSLPVSSSASSEAPGPPPFQKLPALPWNSRQRTLSTSILSKVAPFYEEESTSDIPSRSTKKAGKVRNAEAIFQNRIRKDEEHRWRKAWLDTKNAALRKAKIEPAIAAKELGELYLQAGTERGGIDEQALDIAAAWFEKALDADASQADAYYLLARSYDRPGADPIRLERAQYAYRTAVTMDETQPRYWCSLGVFEAARKHYDRSKTAFDKCIQVAAGKGPNAAIAWSNLGQLYEHHWAVVGDGRPESERFETALQAYLTAFELARGTAFAMSILQRYDRLQQTRSGHFEEAEAGEEVENSVGEQLSVSARSPLPWRFSDLSAFGRQSLGLGEETSEPAAPDTPLVASASTPSGVSPRHPSPAPAKTSPLPDTVGLSSAFSNPTASAVSHKESRRSRRSSSGSSHRARQVAGLQRIVDGLDRQTNDARERNDRLVEVLSQIRDRLPATALPSEPQLPPRPTDSGDATLLEALRMLGEGSSRLGHVIREHERAPAGLRALNALLTTSCLEPPIRRLRRPESR